MTSKTEQRLITCPGRKNSGLRNLTRRQIAGSIHVMEFFLSLNQSKINVVTRGQFTKKNQVSQLQCKTANLVKK